MKALPTVSVIIVNFNGEKFIEKCLVSLKKLNYPPSKLEIIVVDNGSKDKSLDIIRDKFTKVKILINDINNYCKANNLGIKNSKGDLIAFLNNDTEVDKNWLIELVKIIQKGKKTGITGSKILFPNGLINSAGQKEHPYFYFKDEGFKEEDNGQYDEIKEVDSLCGCSVLYKRECIKDVGLFDEDLIMYCEDVDMAIKCKKNNWKLYYVPKSIVKHEYNGTSNLELQEKYVERNRVLLLAKHYPDRLPVLMFGSVYFKNNDEIFQIIPEIIKKVITTHGYTKFEEISKDFFNSMRNYFYSKKDYLIKNFEIERKMFKESKERLRYTNKKLEKELKEIIKNNKNLVESKEKIRIQLEKELQKNNNLKILKTNLKTELENLKTELENLKTEYNDLKTKLNDLYNSKGYRWILSNVWALSNKIKKDKNVDKKSF